ncbi:MULTISPECIES: hypothetical protein [Providencia]|uniref:Uncharacterized protein n=1 Tax=Providencia rettgeri TaxID=587 RepID=A0A9N8H2H7_PRORE|nr:hypothetical protein [Providencia rettgeri]CAB5645060.1 Uncharacterised protein [Providencia rettgeri]CAB5709540.1 Uncharacterised protein [Providencia rettgeri]CAC9186266.1 Uncharacterised protein [Providencia rettgeri]CAC9226956.1 Uncharacterised protein [Providencia rettgeri]
MELKHTPAPWKYTIRNANEIMTTFHGVTIGDVYLDITTANQKADARLIAAAPELLSTLQLIISYHDDGNEGLHREDLEMARKAIAKALGQQ